MSTENKKKNSAPKFLDLAFPFRIISGFLFASIVTLTVVQVFFRFVLDSPLIWSEELVRLFLVWLTFLGAEKQQGQGYTFDKAKQSILNNRAIFNLTLL